MYQQKFYFKIYFKILNAAWIIASNSFQNFKKCAIRESSTYTCTFYFWSREKCELAKPIFRSCIGQNVFKGSNQWSVIVQTPYPDGRYYFDQTLGLVLLTWGKQKVIIVLRTQMIFYNEIVFFTMYCKKNATECIWLNFMTAIFHVVH